MDICDNTECNNYSPRNSDNCDLYMAGHTTSCKDFIETDKDKQAVVHCSFCDKTQEEVCRLVAGATVYICNECIDICHQIVHEGETDFKKLWVEVYEMVMENKAGLE